MLTSQKIYKNWIKTNRFKLEDRYRVSPWEVHSWFKLLKLPPKEVALDCMRETGLSLTQIPYYEENTPPWADHMQRLLTPISPKLAKEILRVRSLFYGLDAPSLLKAAKLLNVSYYKVWWLCDGKTRRSY